MVPRGLDARTTGLTVGFPVGSVVAVVTLLHGLVGGKGWSGGRLWSALAVPRSGVGKLDPRCGSGMFSMWWCRRVAKRKLRASDAGDGDAAEWKKVAELRAVAEAQDPAAKVPYPTASIHRLLDSSSTHSVID